MSAVTFAEALATLESKFPFTQKIEFRGETTLIFPRAEQRAIMERCFRELGFDYLVDISSVDHFGEDPRFEMVYELCRLSENARVRIKFPVPEEDAVIPTVSDLWATADWHEREIYDMMGIHFEKHPDLRRILMWDGFPHFPLRKDFPLAGKSTDVPEVAFTQPAPLAGGPFVTAPMHAGSEEREPRARPQT